jgi:hypothetical protein
MIYHVISEKYYRLSKEAGTQAASTAQQIFLSYPFDEPCHIEQWEFVPFLPNTSSFCIECKVRTQEDEDKQLLFTIDFSDTGAKATCYEPVQ